MAKKNKINPMIILGIIAAFLLIAQIGFLGSFITTCDNIEPASLMDLQEKVINNVGAMNLNSAKLEYVNNDNQTIFLDIYDVTAGFGEAQIMQTIESCKNTLSLLSLQNRSELNLGGKSITTTINNDFWFCNKNDNLLIKTTEIETISNYYAAFEICYEEEVIDEQIDNGTTREENISTTTSTTPTVTTPTAKNNNNVAIIIGTLIIAFAAYWFLERGPEKGLIKKKGVKRK